MQGGVFQHGVASGDPLTDAIVLWTQVTTADGSVPVTWTLARDRDLKDVVASGEATAEAEHDHTVHVDVRNLESSQELYYGFSALGSESPVARTRLLPENPDRIRFATCSCARFDAGYFNAYRRIAAREDLNFLLHLGDYIYETSNTPPKNQVPSANIGRPFEPQGECVTLDDYRTRYRQYRRDPDIQALHHAIPLIPTIDDHELADGAWGGGADAHDESRYGPWSERKAASFQARWEWHAARKPNPDDWSRVFRSVKLGDLAEIFLLDIRSRRHQPALEPEMSDPSRSMLGAEQRDWLFAALDSSTAAWKLVGSPSIMKRTWQDNAGEPLATALLKLKLMDEDGEGPDEDQWDGYPVERRAVLERLDRLDDAVVLSADIHVSLAGELTLDDHPVAVEITAPSLTSQNLDDKLGVERRDELILASEQAMVEAFDHIDWCELASHGYVVVDVTSERLRAEWWHVEGVRERADGEERGAAFEVPRGEIRVVAAS
ncbi:MAG: alkaline phosphatase [Solirubrobacterales bacterium]|nr:alkaline phosphatase [Solirubrobacterales bacterium]